MSVLIDLLMKPTIYSLGFVAYVANISQIHPRHNRDIFGKSTFVYREENSNISGTGPNTFENGCGVSL